MEKASQLINHRTKQYRDENKHLKHCLTLVIAMEGVSRSLFIFNTLRGAYKGTGGYNSIKLFQARIELIIKTMSNLNTALAGAFKEIGLHVYTSIC